MYAAAWAHTSRAARASPRRRADTCAPRRTRADGRGAAAPGRPRGGRADPRLAFGAGAATALGLVALARRRRR